MEFNLLLTRLAGMWLGCYSSGNLSVWLVENESLCSIYRTSSGCGFEDACLVSFAIGDNVEVSVMDLTVCRKEGLLVSMYGEVSAQVDSIPTL